MNFIKKLAIFTLLSLPFSAYAAPMAQRNCNPSDIEIVQNATAETTCEWLPNDDVSMQVTLHANKNDVPFIKAACTFTPAPGSDDQIDHIVGKKSAGIGSVNKNGNSVTFDIINYGNDANLNVLFYLNKRDDNYAAGDKIHCSFVAYTTIN